MKVLLSITVLLAFVLTSCANIPANMQENTPLAPPVSDQGDTSPENVSENTVEVVGGDEEALREFIRQWAVPGYSSGGSQDIIIYIGSTPNDMPYDVPVPEGSRIVGSVTGTWADYMLIFDSDLTAESIHEFYGQALIDKGWKEAPNMQGGGFTGQSYSYETYCYGENEAVLSVETPSIFTEKTSLRLTLDISPDSPMCNTDPNAGPPYMSVIPELRAPLGITVQGTGAGSSDRDANMTANLKGNLSAAELIDSYNEQLLAAGWELQNASEGEGAAWSNWAFTDEQGTSWFGALMVMEASPENNTLFAFVSIEKTR
jgi:hypothetical protein